MRRIVRGVRRSKKWMLLQKDEAQEEGSRITKREVRFSKDSNLAPHFY